jgi:DNA-binding CsgD family transcriptional regulator
MSTWTQTIVKKRVADGAGDFVLNKKEVQFLELCCQDIPYWQIAERMGKSRRTIDGYRDILFEALEVRSRTGLVLWCFKTGFFKVKDIRLNTYKREGKKKSPAKNSRAGHMRK